MTDPTRIDAVAREFVESELDGRMAEVIDYYTVGAHGDPNRGKVCTRDLFLDERDEEFLDAEELQKSVGRVAREALSAWKKSR